MTGAATKEQLRVADAVGCPHAQEPIGVLTALIEAWLRPSLYGNVSLLATPRQLEFLESLDHEQPQGDMARTVASAWISHHLSVRTANALESLQLKAGDRVSHEREFVDPDSGEVSHHDEVFMVSSIGTNGLVYFRGGNGKCGWPSSLRRA